MAITKFTDEEWRDVFLPVYYPKRIEGLKDAPKEPRVVEGLTGSLRPAIEAGLAAVAAYRVAKIPPTTD